MYQNSSLEILILDKEDSSFSCLNSNYSNYYLNKQIKLRDENKIYFFKIKK